MRRPAAALVAIVVASLMFGYAACATSPQASTLEGTWRTVEVTVTNSEGSNTRQISQPNLTIFADGHYASLTVFGAEPRENLPEEPTDEQRLAAWRPFAANAGSYSISGSDITTRVLIAKSSNATAENRETTTPFELDGDVLHRTFTNDSGTTFHVKYERVRGNS